MAEKINSLNIAQYAGAVGEIKEALGVATYLTAEEMPENLRNTLPEVKMLKERYAEELEKAEKE